MKKTLIALMAMSSVTMATTLTYQEFDKALNEAITNSGYTWGADSTVTSWTLQFTIARVNAKGYTTLSLLTLKEGTYVVAQQPTSNSDSSYLGVSSITTDVPKADGATTSWIDPDYISADGCTRTWIADDMYNDEFPVTWLSYNKNGAHVQGALANTTITLSSSLNKTQLTVDFNNGTTSIVEYDQALMLDLNKVEINNYITDFKDAKLTVNGAAYSIPEPTTATLSLLALAGLAARRRRR